MQITKNLIKELNTEKLNLVSSLNCYSTNNYNYYEYEENSTINHISSSQGIDNTHDIYLKNEDEDSVKVTNSSTGNETNKYEMDVNESKSNEEMDLNNEHLDDFRMDSPVADSELDDVNKTEDNISKHSNIKIKVSVLANKTEAMMS